jgi:hypothetical protein
METKQLMILLVGGGIILMVTAIAIAVIKMIMRKNNRSEQGKALLANNRAELLRKVPELAQLTEAEQDAVIKRARYISLFFALCGIGLVAWFAFSTPAVIDFINNGPARGVGFVVGIIVLPIILVPTFALQRMLLRRGAKRRLR